MTAIVHAVLRTTVKFLEKCSSSESCDWLLVNGLGDFPISRVLYIYRGGTGKVRKLRLASMI
jgi:hypothetical protein